MSVFKNKAVLTGIAVTAAVAVIAVAAKAGDNVISKGVRMVFSPFQSGVAKIASSIEDAREFVWEMRGYKDENERLSAEIYELRKENKSIEEYREENARLRSLLQFQGQMDGYSTVAGQVVSYEPNNWYDTIVINRGTSHGVREGSAVITDKGVVGKVVGCGANWARVSSVLNTDNAIGVRLTRTGEVAVVEGDSALCAEGTCKMSFIDKNASIIMGDLLETSGSGDVYPAGLSVGAVTEVNRDNMGTLQYAVVKPSVDFSSLHEVLIITGDHE